ncbi:MAG TPA: peptidylprolyl isomerase, partial [Chitinophagaceae bacterium]|nr:peptidylprolyl isomerase [Chitinophagaceae bacterium]
STINSNPQRPTRFLNILPGIIAILITGAVRSQPLFTYGSKQVSKSEFRRAYLKNNDTSAGNKASDIRNYLELYTRFKLKVQAAYDMKLDTLLKQQEEVMNFRQQIEEPYMRDNSVLARLLKEAEERGKKDIRLAHIFVPFKKEYVTNPLALSPATVQDSAAAKARITEAYEKLKRGDDFSTVAMAYSMDPAVQTNKGDLGYITVFSLPYNLETIGYSLPLNAYSEPYRSDAGWHILKKTAERPAVGKVKARQILIAVDRQGAPEEKKRAAALADSLYRLLKAGTAFEELARSFSYDNSALQGGELPLIGIGEYDEVFEKTVFGIQRDGDITPPFETSMGYHIVKREGRINYSNDAEVPEHTWKYAVEKDKRGMLPITLFEKQCVTKSGMKKRPVDEKELFRYTDSFLVNNKKIYSAAIKDNTVLVEFPNEKVTVDKWLEYVVTKSPERSTVAYRKFYNDFYKDMSVAYYRKNLEKFDPEFKAQYNEFMEGNMLFEVMERKVWNKSSSDTAALKKHYEVNKAKYSWGKSADVIIMNAPDMSLAEQARKLLTADPGGWRSIVETTDGKVMADSGRVEWTQMPGNSDLFKIGYTTPFVTNKEDKSVSFYHIVNLYPHSSQKSFEDSKGQLINDYQVELEEKWIAGLKKKYPVKVNAAILEQAIKELR